MPSECCSSTRSCPTAVHCFHTRSIDDPWKVVWGPRYKEFPSTEPNWTELKQEFEGRYRKIIKKQYFSSRSSPKVLFYVFSHSPFVGPRCGSTTVLFDEHYVRHDFYGYNHKCPTPPRTKDGYLFTACGPRRTLLPRFFLTTMLSDSHTVDTDQRHPKHETKQLNFLYHIRLKVEKAVFIHLTMDYYYCYCCTAPPKP